MSQIYRKTQGVLAWLGEEDEDTSAGMAVLRDLAESYVTRKTVWTKDSRSSEEKRAALRALPSQVDFPAITRFFGLDWFCRIWILQEVALPPHVTMWSGSQAMDFEDLAAAILVLADILREPIAAHRLGSEWKNPMSLTSARVGSQRKNGTQKPILGFVRGNVGKGCRNDLDRIYALLGCGTTTETLKTILCTWTLRKGDLSVLHCAGKTNEASDQHQETSLPTWVPDWRCNFKLVEGNVGGKDIPDETIFNALTQSPASILLEKDSTSFIGIAGTLIGKVNELSKFLVVSPTSGLLYSYEEYQGLVKAHSLYFEVSKGKPYPTGEDSERAFARAIVMDNRTPRSTFSLGRDVEPELLLYKWLRLKKSLKDMSPDQDIAKYIEDWPQAHREAAAYLIVANNVCRNRQLLMIESGYIGLAPIATEKGDAIVVFDGAETPFILRRLRPKTKGEAASEPDNAARHIPKE